jgi:hypothetical protein
MYPCWADWAGWWGEGVRLLKQCLFLFELVVPKKMASLSFAASVVRPSLLHLRLSNTSSMGMFSYTHKVQNFKPKRTISTNKSIEQTKLATKKMFQVVQIYYQIHGFLQHSLQNFRLVFHLFLSL